MNFIELTSHDGKKIWVNFNNVTFFHIGNGEDKIYTEIRSDEMIISWVREPPEQILQKINEAVK